MGDCSSGPCTLDLREHIQQTTSTCANYIHRHKYYFAPWVLNCANGGKLERLNNRNFVMKNSDRFLVAQRCQNSLTV